MNNLFDVSDCFVVDLYDKDLNFLRVGFWPRSRCFPRFFKKFLSENPNIFMLTCQKYGSRKFITSLSDE